MFSGGKAQGSQKPTAMGTLVQSSAYGSAIPTIYGMTQSPLLAIWAANIRQGLSSKKLKNFLSGKKGTLSYCENIDFLIGHNPIMCVNQMWNNGALNPLTLTSATFSRGEFASNVFTIGDDNFYSLIAVTIEESYSASFNDYGSSGPVSASGTYERPLWNELEQGPDPTNASGFKNYPYCYRWEPGYGNTFFIDGIYPGNIGGTFKAYYYQLMDATSYEPPIQKNNLAFENELGNGSEYDGYSDQQIIYPMFAGLGSPNVDLGTSAALPSFQAEVKAKWGIYPNGDADFADIIEDIIKSGVSQAAIGASTTNTASTTLSHGLAAYNFPGPVQKQQTLMFEGYQAPQYNQPNTAGNVLVVIIMTSNGSPATISDSAGNTWVLATSQTVTSAEDFTMSLYYCQGCKGYRAGNTVTFSNGFYYTYAVLLELAGVDTFDVCELVTGQPDPTVSVTTTNEAGFPEYMMALTGYYNLSVYIPNDQLNWPVIVPGQLALAVQARVVKNPGTYSLQMGTLNGILPGAASWICIIGFKSTTPTGVPAPVPDFVDMPSLDLVRTQCRAYGLFGSLTMTSQQSASDWLKSLYQAANATPVFYGFKMYSFPLAEQSAIGNGAIYTSPTASGPVANLSDLNGDFVTNGSKDVVTLQTVDRSDQDNVLQMQCFSRDANYNQVVVSLPIGVAVALYGTRKADPVVNAAVQDTTVALSLLGVMVRKMQLGGDEYSFTIVSKYDWLTPMDLITVTDTLAGIFNQPVRIESMEEQEDGSWSCIAYPFIYGMESPTALTALSPVPSGQNKPQASAGNVNTPIIFEPPARLSSSQQLWIAVSSGSAIYGGCQVLISTDGGSSYQSAGTLTGSATTGVTTADWPAAADPDTTNNLQVNLSESLGLLESYTTAEENNFGYPCLVAGGTSAVPFELMAYGEATLTSANNYTLQATGSGNQLRRSVFGCPTTGEGVDHASGSRFLFVDPTGQGILKLALPPQWIGTELYVKVLSFNNLGGGLQDASDVTPVTYTPSGVASSSNPNTVSYTQSPEVALTNPTATTIDMAAVTETFLSNSVKYNARNFTIPAPSVNTWYYVTIADPGYTGDVGSSLTRTAYCETSSAKVGLAGYTFIGAILAAPSGGSTIATPGGYPTQQLFLVNGG